MLRQFPKRLQTDIIKICKMVAAKRGTAYLVGGCIRDALIGAPIEDADIEVYGLSGADLQRMLAARYTVNLVGKSYAVYKLQQANIDLSIPRQEVKQAKGHKAFSILADPKLTPQQASLRRDFTVNALLYDPLEDRLLDYHNGLTDLRQKLLRPVSPRFKEDPLRALRAMQFIARFGFRPDLSTVEYCRELDQSELPRERIMGEWEKMLLQGKSISHGLSFLDQINWLNYYPELVAIKHCPQDPAWHPEGDVWAHTKLCLDAFAYNRHKISAKNRKLEQLIIGLGVLTHDLGKAITTYFEQERIRSPKHEAVGVDLAKKFIKRLTLQTEITNGCLPLVRYHMQPYVLYKEKSTASAIRRLAARVERLDRLLWVCRADFLGCGRDFNSEVPHLDWLAEKAAALAVADQAPRPIVMGRHIKALNIPPGVIYKRLLADCYDAQIAGEFSDLAAGLEFLNKIISAK